ncbi:hydrogenase 4 subunit B [Roseomonas eburnea]|uniref:Hydrogenase 4 subunit B n=1 Tax=Neoroseomonas eburnea TaxID=1346889 RepID=A0A9X9X6P8_9PROT|nr:proton-conducting transporter membrane subunit [Neoroseomonas eburnea]MBR0679384.1 hydrogenase 4 subunit B [Neoroseomonas eburnea]
MLTALALLVATLAALGFAGLALARRPAGARLLHGACAVAGFALVAGGVAGLLGGPQTIDLPFGPPWGPARLALDPLSSWFLLPLGIAVACASLFALGGIHGTVPARELVPWPLFIAGMALTVLSADGFTLLLGFEAMSLASWALVAHDHAQAENRRAARIYLGFAGFGGLTLILAIGLLAGGAGDVAFAVLREAPPEGLRAIGVLLLVLAGTGSKAGLAPLHVWLPLAHPAAPSHVSAVMSGAMTKVALYILARFAFDLMGPAQPFWMGAPLIALGAASAVIGALRANLEDDTKTLLACSTIENVGLIAMGLGLALAFRGSDLTAMAALAAGAALLHALNHAVFKTLLFLAAGEVLHGALSRRLDRLGGLIHRMPWTAWAALVGTAAAASLPPLSGFASEWLLLQALLAGWRVGDLAFQMGVAAATALAALAAALAASAMVRFWGLAFLGRPRTPRAAGAEETGGAARIALLLPAGLTVLLGLAPGLMLDLAEPALRLMAGAAAPRAGSLAIGAAEGGARYWPLFVAALLAGAIGLAVWLVRRRAPAGVARGPAWDCGFIAAPPHLPFGDPATQPSAAGFGQPLRRMLGESLLAARESVTMPPPGDTRPALLRASHHDPVLAALEGPLPRWREAIATQAEKLRDLSIRQCLGLTFGAVVLMLALLAWLEAR